MGRAGGRAGGGFSGGRGGGFSGGMGRSGGFSGAGRSGGSRGGSGGRRVSGGGFGGFGGFGGMGGFSPRSIRTGPIIINNAPRQYNTGPSTGGGGPSPDPGRNKRGGSGIGVMLLILLLVFFFLLLSNVGSSSSSIARSTIERKPLAAGSVDETGYFTDELGWIVSESQLTAGMRSFYKQTGIQPYLYLTDTVNGSHNVNGQQLGDFARGLYQTLFTDQAHFLVVFHEYNDEYTIGYMVGAQAVDVLDEQAIEIFRGLLDRYYYSSNMSDEQFFSTVFDELGNRIMRVERSPWPYITIAAMVLAAIIAAGLLLLSWQKRRRQQQVEQAQRIEEMLNTPLETFEEQQLDELEKKYQQDKGGS